MKKPKVVIVVIGLSLLLVGISLSSIAIARTATSKQRNDLHVLSSPVTANKQATITPITVVMPIVVSLPTVAPTQKPSISPTTASTPKAGSTPNPAPAQPAVTDSLAQDRYYPLGTSVAAIKSGAASLTKQQVKVLIEREVHPYWSVIQSKLGIATEADGYAFFLGMATCESTLNSALETGSGPSHSYGAIQTAEPAYANTNANYAPENDVPELPQYDFTPQNYYDPGIAIHMGIRHLLHFANQARAAGYTGNEYIRHALIGYNTGTVNNSNQSWLHQYSDEIGAIAGWYLNNGHLYDTAFTWTGSPVVKRSNPWSWY